MPINVAEKILEKIPHKFVVKMQAVYDSLKTAEKKAADLLIHDPQFFANATIIEAADRAGCSEATIIRMARRLGYKGYPELKANLIEGQKQKYIDLYGDINEGDNCQTVMSKVFKASIQALNDTLNTIDMNEYEKAVNAICKADKIAFCGVGDAAAVAQSGYHKFIRLGFNAIVSADPDVQLIAASHLSNNDVLIVISHSGRTKSVLEVVKHAKIMGVRIISITNYPFSPLTKHSDIVLITAAFTEHMKGEIICKRITELCLLESLYVSVLLEGGSKLIEGLERSNSALELNKL